MIPARASCASATAFIIAAFGLTSAVTPPASATEVRAADHQGFGRIVLNTNGKANYQVEQFGDHVVIHLTGDVSLESAPSPPRNVASIKTNGATVDLVLAHGARLRTSRVNGHVVIDALDMTEPAPKPRHEDPPKPPKIVPPQLVPPPAAKAPPGEKPPPTAQHLVPPKPPGTDHPAPAPEAPAPQTPAPTAAEAPPPPLTAERQPVAAQALAPPNETSAIAPPPATDTTMPQSTADAGLPGPVQPAAPGRDVLPENEGPLVLRARRSRLPRDVEGSAFIVPFEATTAAAAFDEGDGTTIVFDERRPVDLAGLARDPLFAAASVRLLPNGTLFQVPHPSNLSIVLTQLPQGWRIAALAAKPKLQPIVAANADKKLNLTADQPGDVVNLADPITGATLLVGTQHRPGQGMVSSRRTAEFVLRQSTQGVVVEALSDVITLKQIPTGFSIAGAPAGLALSPSSAATPVLMDAAHLTRRLNLSTMPTDSLLRLAVKQVGDAAKAPPLARGPRHRIAAESLLALGLAAEAESLLRMAVEQDPKEAASPATNELNAVAALLAGRTDEAHGLSDPGIDATDEAALWRAVLQATHDEGSPAAAAVFAATAPLAFQYPEAIRKHILPLIIETMIQGGQVAGAVRLLDQRKDDPKLAYARGLLSQTLGKTTEALAQFDAIAAGHDQFDRARAAVQAVELRLANEEIDKTQAADALDKLLYAWRGDARDLALRERVADLRGQTGAWRPALAMMRQAEIDFPEKAASIHTRLKDMFATMIRDPNSDKIPSLDFVATIDENTDLVPDLTDSGRLDQALADRLVALDLPSRAKPLLEKLAHEAKTDVSKARFGSSLASLNAHEGDDAGALAALDASQGKDLPADLIEQRLLVRAGSMARRGDPTGAAAILTSLHSNRAMETRAQILEAASDWPGAEQVWTECAATTLPASGLLDEAQIQLVLRLATATTRAHDDAGIAMLRDKFRDRVGNGPLADMFRLLTAEPVKTTADIKRSKSETSLAASLPADLKALQAKTVNR